MGTRSMGTRCMDICMDICPNLAISLSMYPFCGRRTTLDQPQHVSLIRAANHSYVSSDPQAELLCKQRSARRNRRQCDLHHDLDSPATTGSLHIQPVRLTAPLS